MNTKEENERYKKMKKNILDRVEESIKLNEPNLVVRWIEALDEVSCKIEIL